MRNRAVQLVLAVLLLLAFRASASHTPPALPDFQDTTLAESAHVADPIDWAALEADPDAVLGVLLIPQYDPESAVLVFVPCDPKNRLYRRFRDGVIGVWGGVWGRASDLLFAGGAGDAGWDPGCDFGRLVG